MMNLLSIKGALFYIVIALSISCNSGTGNAQGLAKVVDGKFEGYVDLTVQVFADIDDHDNPIDPIEGDEAVHLGAARRMYLYDNVLLDIVDTKHFEDGKFQKMDTSTYSFYDLERQMFARFDTLSLNAKMVANGLMEADGAFSKGKSFDPLGNSVDSVTLTDTITDDRPVSLARFELGDAETDHYIRRIRFFVDPQIHNFPLQLSYALSTRAKNSFVYKMQLPMQDGKMVMVTELRYREAKLDANLAATLLQWKNRLRNM